MAIVLCPSCQGRGFIWSINGEDEPTYWWCNLCNYSAKENESKEKHCPACGQNGAVLLTHEDVAFYWCVLCGGYREQAT